MLRDNFGVIILSNGRPDHVYTLETLIRSNYSGPWRIVVDNEDPTRDEYRRRYGAANVVEFDKAAVAETTDTADTVPDRRSDVFVRNASFDIARDLGWDYYVQLDDDYDTFRYRFVDGDYFRSTVIRRIDDVIEATLTFLDASGAVCVAWSQGGDHMGGIDGNVRRGFRRKAMNSLFFRTDCPLRFVGRINDDVNMYVVQGSRGDLFFTVMPVFLNQKATQSSEGGMTDVFREGGTYVKSFYTVMMAPSCVSVGMMGRTDKRFHHHVRWDVAVPKIISETHRRTTTLS